jgi:hypothetical protein
MAGASSARRAARKETGFSLDRFIRDPVHDFAKPFKLALAPLLSGSTSLVPASVS